MPGSKCFSRIVTSVALLLLSGCASFSPDGGFGTVEQAVSSRTGQTTQWVRSPDAGDSVQVRVGELLARPISADDAVRIALLNNAGLQADYASLGIAEAELVQASRWRGPRPRRARAPTTPSVFGTWRPPTPGKSRLRERRGVQEVAGQWEAGGGGTGGAARPRHASSAPPRPTPRLPLAHDRGIDAQVLTG